MDTDGGWYGCYRNETNISVCLYGSVYSTAHNPMETFGYFLDESTDEKEYFTDDVEIYFEKELEVEDKTNYIPTVHYVDNHYMQTSNGDSVFDAFNNSDPNPEMVPEAWIVNETFVYSDNHILTPL